MKDSQRLLKKLEKKHSELMNQLLLSARTVFHGVRIIGQIDEEFKTKRGNNTDDLEALNQSSREISGRLTAEEIISATFDKLPGASPPQAAQLDYLLTFNKADLEKANNTILFAKKDELSGLIRLASVGDIYKPRSDVTR